MEHKIVSVEPKSIAAELEIEAGDVLVSINEKDISDVFDYRYFVQSEKLTLLIRKSDGEEWELDIEKDPYDDLGLEFENGLMSEYRSCSNKCVFCFIDQMPKGMREGLYFKDDDSRLSFLQGNYITLTNITDKDIQRMIEYRLEPINISVHTTNPELRAKMLNNRFAGDALRHLDTLFHAGLTMNGQIVLCKGLNDGEELHRSLSDLYNMVPVLESVSVVPVGLSKYRDGLYPLESFQTEDAKKVIDEIEYWQKKAFQEHGTHFVHASDEFYLLAGRELPEEERYDGYLQIENGVGMIRSLMEEVKETLSAMTGDERKCTISYATGLLAEPFIKQVAKQVQEKFTNVELHVYGIRNDFFGEKITVAGLLTGQDILAQLKDQSLGETLVLPACMFKSGTGIFLDDMTRDELEEYLDVPIVILPSGGDYLVHSMIGEFLADDSRHGEYEI